MSSSSRKQPGKKTSKSPASSFDMLPELSADGKIIIDAMIKQFEDMKAEFAVLLAKKDDEIAELKSEIGGLRKLVVKLEERVDDADAYERRDTLEISGKSIPPCTRDEVCSQLVLQHIRDKLKVNMAPSDISVAHRIGKKPQTQKTDNRNIILKLCRRDLKKDLLDACRKFKPKDFFINESLTPARKTISYVLRQAKKRFPDIVNGCSTREGKVYVWVKHPNSTTTSGNTNTKIPINTHTVLQEFCCRTLGVPLNSFIDSWPH